MSGRSFDGRGKAVPTTITVRPEIARFAELMEVKMAQNDHKPPWRGESIRRLLDQLFDEFLELQHAVDEFEVFTREAEPVIEEAVDVANFAMMIADVVTQRNRERAGEGGL